MAKIIQVYEPVIFTSGPHKGTHAVQVREPGSLELLGWADGGAGKFDRSGEWEVCAWTPAHERDYTRVLDRMPNHSVAHAGVSRTVTVTF
jgi:hypothetical protein